MAEQKRILTATVVAINDEKRQITVSCAAGRVVVDASDNWHSLKQFDIGTEFDLVETYAPMALKYFYELYPLGSVQGSPAWVKKFITNPRQDAVVKNFWYFNDNQSTHIECWSPVWKDVEFSVDKHVPIRYHDVITIERYGDEKNYYYCFVKNKTFEEETKSVIDNKLFPGFSYGLRQYILSKSDEILHSNQK